MTFQADISDEKAGAGVYSILLNQSWVNWEGW